MDWNAPVPAELPRDITAVGRLTGLLGHYDFRVFVTPDAYIDVGAGSLRVVERVDEMRGAGLLGTIGRFCEVNDRALILGAGEHDNDQPVNITFGGFPAMKSGKQHEAMSACRPFRIGSGVVISAGAIILSEADIGDGAVIGAGAIVTRPVEAFGIYAGVPARRIRSRTPCVPWWDFEASYLLENQARLNAVVLGSSESHRYRGPQPRFVLHMQGGSMNLAGFLDGDRVCEFDEAPAKVREYVSQAVKSDKPYWLANCWA